MAVLALPSAAAAESCPATVDPAAFANADALRTLNAVEAGYGPRPTASPAHEQFIDWLATQAAAIPGVDVRSKPYETQRWDPGTPALEVAGSGVRVSAPVPYSASTGAGGTSAPLVYLPKDTTITAANSAGKIVLRDLPVQGVPQLLFYPPVLGYSFYDPAHTVNPLKSWETEVIGQSEVDIKAAAAAGAKGVLEVSRLPHDQLAGSFAPYEGRPLPLPGAYLAADEGKQVKDALAAGGTVTAKLTQPSGYTTAATRTVLATIPGASPQKIVIESHTDGMSAIWDNGPIAMLAMARYFAALPQACRPRTIQFAFVTGHLHQRLLSPDGLRDGGAGQLAAELDSEYDQGKVAGVVVLEHLGAKQYAAVPRPGGLPGARLEQNGYSELFFVPVTASFQLRQLVVRQVRRHDLGRTAVLQGLDLIDLSHVPRHCSFGGEGTPYNLHLIPTVAAIAAPQILFSPDFGLEAIDFALMHRQTLAFTDVVLEMGRMSQAAIAGRVTFQRLERRLGNQVCPGIS